MGLAAILAGRLGGEDRRIFVPGATTDGHYQIEMACTACHTASFASRDDLQAACEGCHADALDAARDSHPKSKFTDPRNADRTALLDARYCVTCHAEHEPAATHSMGLTVPEDFCVLCHAGISDERPTHDGFEFTTCASAGCHNFHDNTALYEDFLLKHAEAPAVVPGGAIPERNFASIARYVETYPIDAYPLAALTAADADAPASAQLSPASAPPRGAGASAAAGFDAALLEWEASAHAANGVNCTACHAGAGAWSARPGYEACGACHAEEAAGFRQGRHGMRGNAAALGVELPPMPVAEARLPMKAEPRDDAVDCGSCHPAHEFDTAFAAVDACLGCHDDEHSLAYPSSPHAEPGSDARAGRVTCATCHMPRVEKSYEWGAYVHVLVQHNQSDGLRPAEKMIRSVCIECHGLGFSIDALADAELTRRNFDAPPGAHVPSIDLAVERRGSAARTTLNHARQGANE
ncbi:MAG: cytochrome c3 family protein [Gammaproteobacteria bacterium]|nr:cytochrome c3 family protein [Gammaproteobacteria bacterium]